MDPVRTNDALGRSIAAVAATTEGLESSLRKVMEEAASALDVERASAWLYSADGTAIRCVELFVRSAATHESGVELHERDYPKYFAAIREARTITAHDAHTDPSTSEFSAGYLRPLGIGAMLDCPIRVGGEMIGVLCNEHVGPARSWTEAEARFAASIADLIAIAIEASRRRETEQQLRTALELLGESP